MDHEISGIGKWCQMLLKRKPVRLRTFFSWSTVFPFVSPEIVYQASHQWPTIHMAPVFISCGRCLFHTVFHEMTSDQVHTLSTEDQALKFKVTFPLWNLERVFWGFIIIALTYCLEMIFLEEGTCLQKKNIRADMKYYMMLMVINLYSKEKNKGQTPG